MRIPDENYRPPRRLLWAFAAIILGVIVAVTVHNFNAASADKGSSTQAATGPIPKRHVLASRPGESALDRAERERKAQEAMRDGWEYLDKRDASDAQQAIDIFREALANLDSDNPQYYSGIGRASLILGKPQDAIDAFKKGLEIDPAIADMQSGIGWAYWQLHQPYLAKQAWEAALKIDPESQDAWSAMAWIYLALGRNADAKAGFRVLVDSHPGERNTPAVMGLSMSRSAVPVKVTDVEKYFPLPPLDYLTTPPATTAASKP